MKKVFLLMLGLVFSGMTSNAAIKGKLDPVQKKYNGILEALQKKYDKDVLAVKKQMYEEYKKLKESALKQKKLDLALEYEKKQKSFHTTSEKDFLGKWQGSWGFKLKKSGKATSGNTRGTWTCNHLTKEAVINWENGNVNIFKYNVENDTLVSGGRSYKRD